MTTRSLEKIQRHLDDIADWRAKDRNNAAERTALELRRAELIDAGKELGFDKRTTREALDEPEPPQPFTEAGAGENIIARAGAADAM